MVRECALFTMMSLAACAPAGTSVSQISPQSIRIPINVADRHLDTLVFAGVDLSPYARSVIGFHHDGLLKIRQYGVDPV